MARLIMLFEVMREERIERNRRRRQMRRNFLERPIYDFDFISKYRLSRELFEELCQDVIPLLPVALNNRAMDPVTKILTALNFYARGSYQGAVAQNLDAPMVQQSASNCILEVTEALNTPYILRKYMRFPQTRENRNLLKRNFAAKYAIPGIIGCIDCTHVAIIKPAMNEERFYNRKHFHSLNVQVIADSNFNIISMDASYGGATHDAFIWQHHEIKEHLERTHHQGETAILLGDSGYPLRQYLMTPIENAAEDSPEHRYNQDHKHARNLIERVFGVLKSRWRCLLAARELHYTPRTAGRITIACGVLHNMCNHRGLAAPRLEQEDAANELRRQPNEQLPAIPAVAALNLGRVARNNLVRHLEQARQGRIDQGQG